MVALSAAGPGSFISTAKAARRSGLSRHTILHAALSGDLPTAWCTPGGSRRFHVRDVEAFTAALATTAHATSGLHRTGHSWWQAERRFRDLLEAAPDAILTCDAAGIVTLVNSQAEILFGYRREELVGQVVDLLLPEALQQRHVQHRAGYAADPHTRPMGTGLALYARTKDGRQVPVEISLSPLHDAGEPVVMVVIRDVSARKLLEAALRESDQRFRLAFNEAPTGMAVTASDGRFLEVNQALCLMLGYRDQELLALQLPALTHPDDQVEALEQVRRLLAGEIPTVVLEQRTLSRDGQVLWTQYTASLLRADDGRPLYIIVQLQDITARKAAAAQQQQESETRFRMMVEHAPLSACIIDDQGHFEVVNESFATLFGYQRDDLVQQHLSVLFDPADHQHIYQWYAGQASDAATVHQEYEMIAKGGERLSVLTRSFHLGEHASSLRRASFVTDITAQKRVEQRLAHAAFHDGLTGLANRILFEDRLEQALLVAARHKGQVAVLLLDLDGFKAVNDTHGHAAGDAVLRTVATRLQTCIRSSDTHARLGGDEFGLVLPQVEQTGALRVANAILHTLAVPIRLGASQVHVGASIGIALYPKHGEDSLTLQRSADAAMYGAKQAGGGYQVFGLEHDGPEVALQKVSIDLRHAITRGGLRLYYQPVVHCPTRRVVRVEALLRWEHPRLGLLQPAQFLPMVEQTEAIASLTTWVLEEGIRQASTWHARGLVLAVAVNISALSLEDPLFPTLVAALLRQYGLPPAALHLEVTESMLMAYPEQALGALEALACTGVRLAIDDFGSGHASIMQLRRLPVQVFKLDRAFLTDLAVKKHNTLLTSLLLLGAALGVEVVVEGVETEETWNRLAAVNCQFVQGYYVSRPQPPVQFEQWLLSGSWTA